jgi:hypothetical protein
MNQSSIYGKPFVMVPSGFIHKAKDFLGKRDGFAFRFLT